MISKDEVKSIAKLARLELTEKEVEKMQKDLSSILDYFNVLKKVSKLKVNKEPASAKVLSSQTRKDEIIKKPASLANNLVAQATDKKDGYIKVKSIL